jgi:S1-C subfamily serine protease
VTVTAVHRRSDGTGPGAGPPSSRTDLLREALGRTRRESRLIAAGAVVVVVGAGVLLARSRGGEPSPKKVAHDASVGIVRIARRVNGVEVSHGTGFAIGGGYVLTAAHVVRDGGEFVLTNTAGQESSATIRSAAPCDDLALLDVDGLALRGLPLGRQSALSRGDSVVAVGYPASVTGGRDLTVTSGVVSVVQSTIAIDGLGIPRLPNVLQTDTAVNPGNSGGPLLSTDGRVVGVLSLVVNHLSSGDVSGQAYAVGVDRVRTLLDELRGGRGPGWRGALLSAASGRLAVTAVALGSPAESAGVAVGDEVASLAGVPIPGDFESFCRGVAVAPGASLSFSTAHGEVSLP